jgi:glutathione S-transferase
MLELYDLVGKNDLRFSPFCWRTKAALAYKKIPYTNIPVRYVDKDKIAFSGQGAVPVIRDNGKGVHDSWNIACYLEEKQPEPRLFPGLGLKEACRLFNLYADRTVNPAIARLIVPDIYAIVDPDDREYFRTTREQRLGMTFEQIIAKRAEYRAGLQSVLADLEATLAGQDYLFGLLTYTDFCLFGSLKWLTVVSKEAFFDSTPSLRAWWERVQEQLRL